MPYSDVIRFEALIDKAAPLAPVLDSPCWLWKGTTDAHGYPKFWLGNNNVTAQRAVFLLAGIDIEPGKQAVNLCGNRLCVRREHLVVATLREAHAIRRRGKQPLGLGEITVIRLLVHNDEATIDNIALGFGVTPELVEQIASAG